MKRSEAARYARWSASTACLLALLTLGVYLDRRWVAHREKEEAPPPAPAGVTRQESKLTFSKGLGAQKLFTVEASKATNFKDNAASLLEDVKITIFGKTGARHDVIHTHSCEYEKDGQSIVCSGEVQLDLESAEDAERAKKDRGTPAEKVHVETRGVTFNRETGIAKSDQPVKFVFPNGQGQAIGVEYRSEEGAVGLLQDVRLLLIPGNVTPESKTPRMNVPEPVRVNANSADFERDSRVMYLRGQVKAETASARLLAGEIRLSLDKTFHAERLLATAGADGKQPELASHGKDDEIHLSGKAFAASFTPEGWLTRIEAAGGVKGSREGRKDADHFSADNALMNLRPPLNQPMDLNLTGDVRLTSKTGDTGESRELETAALLVEFAEQGKGEGSALKRVETRARGTLEWSEPVASLVASASPAEAGPSQTKLTADKLELIFDANGRANQLVGSGNVVTDRASPGKPVETATAQQGSAQLLESGGWSQIELQGEVRLKEGDRSAQGDHVVLVRSAQTATLTGNALVRDATTETRAPRITFVQSSGEIRADGGVQSSDFAANATNPQPTMPGNISADALRANSKTGRTLYIGRARLWQGDSVLEADSIEMLREAHTLNASGNVRAVFPQSPGPEATPARALAVEQRAPNKLKLWHVTAGTLTYNEAENRAHLGRNAVAESAEQEVRAPQMDLYFTRRDKGGTAPAASATGLAGAQQVSRAVATGGVIVVQGTRRATAERGEYSAVDGKFVMTGGNPTIFDASEGTTSGRQLTFFLADDTIIVDSEKGSRTLTKHRVEK